MTEIPLTRAIEDFLKAVYVLQQDLTDTDQRVSTTALKDALRISAPSVTDMAQRLEDAKLIDYKKHYGVTLTESGHNIALRVIRRHRLIELYLVQELNYTLDEVHDEAEKLEHAVSDRFIMAVANKLQNPLFDPHGDPIPAPDGTITQRTLFSLVEIPLNTPVRVARLMAEDGDMLRYILDQGFALQDTVEVLQRAPFEGPVTLQLGKQTVVIGCKVAASILVEVEPSA
jgi:DtxR family transcriptional regulator, Mn-dependent transcriptional regulator